MSDLYSDPLGTAALAEVALIPNEIEPKSAARVTAAPNFFLFIFL